jgi:hypothetical protein
MRRLIGFLLACGLAALAACSSSGGVEATFTPGEGGAGVGGSGGSGAGSPASSSSSSQAASSSSSSSAASSSSSAASSSSSGTGGGPACDYDAPEMCANAEELPSINGDTGNDLRVVKGTTSRWFAINVQEGSNFSNQLSFTATLDVPPGMIYALFVYSGDAANPDCLAVPFQGDGSPPAVSLYWGDTFGSDDGLWFAIEVRYQQGSLCGNAAEWTLSVEGHTIP